MRWTKNELRSALLAPALACALCAQTAISFAAGYERPERAHADRYGNLVITRQSGYKQILVGRGDMAASFNALQPEDSHYRGPPASESQHAYPEFNYRCSGGAIVIKGRSYMYGLSRDEVPVITGVCN